MRHAGIIPAARRLPDPGGPTLPIEDTFAGDGALVGRHVTTGNSVWSAFNAGSPTWATTSGVAKHTASSAHESIATVDAGSTSVQIDTTMQYYDGTAGDGIAFRAGDINNFWLFVVSGAAGIVQLFKRVAGSYTQVGGDVSVSKTHTNYYPLSVRLIGSRIVCYFNGDVVFSVVDAALQSNTRCGVRIYNNTNTNFSEFDVIAIPASTLPNGLIRFVDAASAVDLKSGDTVTLAGSAAYTPHGSGRSLATTPDYITVPFSSGVDFSAGMTVAWFGSSIGGWDDNQDLVRISSGDAIYLRPQWLLLDTGAGPVFPPQHTGHNDTWVWMIGTYNGSSSAQFFHNTTLEETHSVTGALTIGSTSMYVGNHTTAADATANVSKFGAIWNRVLTTDEIAELIANPYNAVS